MKESKVLVISHNPFSITQNNGKTLSSFFRDWKKENIAQLFLTLDRFDNDICDNFYRISDLEVLKSLITHKEKYAIFKDGSNNEKNENDKAQVHKNKLYILIRDLFQKRSSFLYCIRNLVWKIVRPWKFKSLNEWIDEFNPDIVFFQSSNVSQVFNLVRNICAKRNIPLIIETTDDYVTPHFSINPFYWIDILSLKRQYKKLVDMSYSVFAIGDTMAEEYNRRFGNKFKVAMNSINVQNDTIPYEQVYNENKIKFLYAGNLGLNRWKILSKIGNELKDIKDERNIDVSFDIYSINVPSNKILKKITIPGVMEFKGSLDSTGLIKERNNSDVLVHVEAFDRKNKNITRLSVSTKIPECLLSERMIFAVGPEEVASIKYINDNDLGIVCTSLKGDELKERIEYIIDNRNKMFDYIKRGVQFAKTKHSPTENLKMIRNEIEEACEL